MMHKNQSVDVHQFAMIPRPDIPRSSFRRQHTHKTTFDASQLIPVFVDEVLPGDTFKLKMTAFARLSTPIYPIMDNIYLDSFFFFVPCRLVWDNFDKFMGEQTNPADSISYVVPTITSAANGFVVGTLADYFGLPTVGQVTAGQTATVNSLPFRAYNLIYNEWFRDENLQNSVVVDKDDGPDTLSDYILKRRNKRHDYFTSCLPWTQKGGVSSLSLAGNATVYTSNVELVTGTRSPITHRTAAGGGSPGLNVAYGLTNATPMSGFVSTTPAAGTPAGIYPSNLYADLSTATTNTINALRQSFQVQRLLERDARGGTRYTEIIRSHFGVISPDGRLQRPEYLGGGVAAINITPIAQTAQTGLTGGTTPLGTLGSVGTVLSQNSGFTQSFTEHGYVIGLVSARADLTYQQGLRKMWKRSTRYDFYFPVFANLGEQAVTNGEIYFIGAAQDDLVFGYQERWGEYRYFPSMITGLFRSTSAGTIDGWHLAQKFTALPTLNSTFIREDVPLSRALAVGAAADGQQFIFDSFFDIQTVRAMPMYSVPGLIDHF